MNLHEAFELTMKARFPDRDLSKAYKRNEIGEYTNMIIAGNFKSFMEGWRLRQTYDGEICRITIEKDLAGDGEEGAGEIIREAILTEDGDIG